jgi:hypothetical protein
VTTYAHPSLQDSQMYTGVYLTGRGVRIDTTCWINAELPAPATGGEARLSRASPCKMRHVPPPCKILHTCTVCILQGATGNARSPRDIMVLSTYAMTTSLLTVPNE